MNAIPVGPFFTGRIILLLILLFPFQLSKAQWQVADSSGAVTVYGMHPYGTNGFIGVSDLLHVSTDAGETWTQRDPTINTFPLMGLFPGVHFTDELNGIFAGGLGSMDQYAILRTTDGGWTWSELSYSNSGAWPRQYHDLQFPTQSVGYAAGTNGRIMKTTDAGSNWTLLPASTAATIRSVHFSSMDVGVIAGDDILMRTTNGGSTWSSVLTVTGEHRMSGSGNAVVAAGSGTVHVSNDAGVNWTSATSPSLDPTDIHVFSDQHFVVIDEILDKAFVTFSGGQFWEEIMLPVSDHLRSVYFRSPMNGCIGGELFTNRSLILSTGNGIGQLLPIASIGVSQSSQCGSTIVTFEAVGVAPGWSTQWFRNGTPMGSSTEIDVSFTTTGAAGIELHVNNGSQTLVLNWNNTVNVIQPFTVDAGIDQVLCWGNQGQLSVAAPPNSIINWSPASGLNDPTSSTPSITGLTTSTTYTVTVANGQCSSMDQVNVNVVPEIPDESWIDLINGSTLGIYDFPDPYNGFMSAGGTMHRTFDGGLTWEAVTGPNITNYSVGRLEMIDAFHGYASAGYTLYKTTDGWNSNTAVDLPILNNSYEHIYTKGRDTAMVWVSMVGNPGKLLRTLDGGNYWELVNPSIADIRDIIWLDDTILLAGGGTGINGAKLYRSDDAGASWDEILLTNVHIALADLEAASDGSVYAVSGTNIFKSTDEGFNWDLQVTHPTNTLTQGIGAVTFQGPDTGYATIGALYRTVNGGACWQLIQSSIPGLGYRITSKDHYTFIQGAGNSDLVLYRDELPPPGLAFTLYEDTICFGNDQLVLNNSIGFTDYEWQLDGELVSTDTHLTLSDLAPGPHTLQLTGILNGSASSTTRTFHVDDYDATPVLIVPTTDCWPDGMISIAAVTPSPTLGHQWFTVGGGGILYPVDAGGDTLEVTASPSPNTYVVRPISLHGCLGQYSEPVQPPAMPWLYNVTGPQEICLPGEITTQYSVTVGTNSMVDGFEWVLTPPDAGVLAPNGATCSITWNVGDSGALLKVRAMNECGYSPYTTPLQIDRDQPAIITQQPTDVTVDVGQAFTLTVQINVPPYTFLSGWYHNGVSLGTNGLNLNVSQAEPSDAGTYYWGAWQGDACGWLYSDTITVTVLDPTDINSIWTDIDHPTVHPNPFDDQFILTIPENSIIDRISLKDVTGRSIWERTNSQVSQDISISVPGLSAGHYHLQLIGPEMNRTIVLIKQER